MKWRLIPTLRLALAFLVSTGCRAGLVTHVVDGDTLDVDGVRVRIIGIDTPERGECGFKEAGDDVRELVAGKTVIVFAADQRETHDRYGRELGTVIVDGGVDIGRTLIAEGYANARYDSRDSYGGHEREQEYRDLDAATPHRCGIS